MKVFPGSITGVKIIFTREGYGGTARKCPSTAGGPGGLRPKGAKHPTGWEGAAPKRLRLFMAAAGAEGCSDGGGSIGLDLLPYLDAG
jgi:hypothetical protein